MTWPSPQSRGHQPLPAGPRTFLRPIPMSIRGPPSISPYPYVPTPLRSAAVVLHLELHKGHGAPLQPEGWQKYSRLVCSGYRLCPQIRPFFMKMVMGSAEALLRNRVLCFGQFCIGPKIAMHWSSLPRYRVHLDSITSLHISGPLVYHVRI